MSNEDRYATSKGAGKDNERNDNEILTRRNETKIDKSIATDRNKQAQQHCDKLQEEIPLELTVTKHSKQAE